MAGGSMRLDKAWMLAWVALAGCQDVIDLDPIDERTPVEARVRPVPITGGTLVVTSDGIAVAADPDRDLVHVVDVDARRLRHTITLEPGDEPGRVTQGSGSLAHVVLRGAGAIATLDLQEGTVLSRRAVCPDPRGVAFDPSLVALHVACADGTLATLDEATGSELARELREPDLRDVMLVEGEVQTSRFREASVVRSGGSKTAFGSAGESVARVAWRTWSDGERVFMLHQLASTEPVPINPPPVSDFEGEQLPYGGGGGFCEPGIATTALTVLTANGFGPTIPIPDAPLTVDAAVSPRDQWVALAMPGAEEDRSTVGIMSGLEDGCFLVEADDGGNQVTAVAFDANGTLVMQSREPARLLVQSEVPNGELVAIALEGESRFDTGHEIFHRATESGLSCASCHPEGTDDGHVWRFEELGKRRTQPLDVGLEGTAPFHWDGDMSDMDVLMEEVLAHRMGGKRQSSARGESFTRWLFEQQRPAVGEDHEDPLVVRQGEELFAAYDCGRCHDGPALGGTQTTPIRDMELQVPSLRRVSLHPPFMHDGRQHSLEGAVKDMIVSTTGTTEPSDDDVAALTAYMRTL